jgi:5,10-methenyltetrahydromethanopterin hydrogenase
LSRVEQADSESVDELVEEGNIFEAGAVAAVEEADDQDTREVHTHEDPEDDVPDEYLEKD